MANLSERNGVRLGQPVRDVDGKVLGRVAHLYAMGFEVARGFPVLFRQSWVVRYDEVRGVRDGALVIARSKADLYTLASGGVPSSWKVPAPAGFPSIATPPEGHELIRAIAASRARAGPPPTLPPEGRAALAASHGIPLGAGAGDPPLSREEVVAFLDSSGQALELEEAPDRERAPPPAAPEPHAH
jgi:hypothetical protein